LMSAFSLQRGDTPSRYYLPWIVAISAIALRAVTLRNRRLVAAGAVLVVGLTTVTSTRAALATWTTDERSGSVALDLAKRVVTGDCPLYLVNFDVERRFAIPRLLPLVQGRPLEACKGSERDAYALTWQTTSLPTGFGHRCRAHWAKLDEQQDVSLYRCTSFSAGPFLDQDAASSAPRIQIVRLRTPTVDDPRAFTPPVERR